MDAITEKTSLSEREEENKRRTKRYNLILPMGLYEQLHTLADDERTTVLELLKRFIKIGMAITTLSQSPGARLIIGDGDKERDLVFL